MDKRRNAAMANKQLLKEEMTMKIERLLIELETIISIEQIITDHESLYDASADRYKKYAKAKKVLDVPMPMAIVYPHSTEEVQSLLKFCNQNKINVIPRSGKTA